MLDNYLYDMISRKEKNCGGQSIMQLRKTKALYSIVIGISLISLWIMLFFTDQIPELKTE